MNRGVPEGNGRRMPLDGMYFKPKYFAWFNLPRGTVLEIPSIDAASRNPSDVHRLASGFFYLPAEFDLPSDLIIIRANGARTRLKGRITVPMGSRFVITPEMDVRYKIDSPYEGEDFSCSFLPYGDMQFEFPAWSSLFMEGRRRARGYSQPPLPNAQMRSSEPRIAEEGGGSAPGTQYRSPVYATDEDSLGDYPLPSHGYFPLPRGIWEESPIYSVRRGVWEESPGYVPGPSPGYNPRPPVNLDESPGYSPGPSP
ncbi:hypothetical protein R1sor_021678 [Riccia sorocarpa]|uniref:Uncharacterized protein n=1 Tax=Riccia sorocarpa TaxID=122646 RepID=A0ABD3GHP7_9MARC